MIIKEEEKIYSVETIEGQEVRKRVKIQSVSLTGGNNYQAIDWFESKVRIKHSKKLDIVGAPSESARVSVGSLSFEDLVNMAGGDMDTFAIAWAGLVETMNPIDVDSSTVTIGDIILGV
jgi:hypothetical protein